MPFGNTVSISNPALSSSMSAVILSSRLSFGILFPDVYPKMSFSSRNRSVMSCHGAMFPGYPRGFIDPFSLI